MKKNIFLNIDEQINHLKLNKLNIDNLNIFKWYIYNFNYKNIISGYNLFFKINNDKNSTFYKPNITSSMIIELFNIDRIISKAVLSDILSIERKLSTLISYVLMKNISKIRYDQKICEGKILNWTTNDILLFFPNLRHVNVKTKNKCGNINLKKNIKFFQKFLFPKKLKNKNSSNKEHPIWVLCLHWTLGETIFIFKMLRIDYRVEILKEFFKNKKNIKIKRNEVSFFEETFIIINTIRNICCHNNVLYDFSYKTSRCNKMICFINKILVKSFKLVKLFTILEIIVYFSPHKTNLIKMCEEKFENTNTLNNDIKKLIKNYTSGK